MWNEGRGDALSHDCITQRKEYKLLCKLSVLYSHFHWLLRKPPCFCCLVRNTCCCGHVVMGLCCFCVLLGYLPASCGDNFPDYKTFCNRSWIKDKRYCDSYLHLSAIVLMLVMLMLLFDFIIWAQNQQGFMVFRCVFNSLTCSHDRPWLADKTLYTHKAFQVCLHTPKKKAFTFTYVCRE